MTRWVVIGTLLLAGCAPVCPVRPPARVTMPAAVTLGDAACCGARCLVIMRNPLVPAASPALRGIRVATAEARCTRLCAQAPPCPTATL